MTETYYKAVLISDAPDPDADLVEAMARSIADEDCALNDWNLFPEDRRDDFRDLARAALSALRESHCIEPLPRTEGPMSRVPLERRDELARLHESALRAGEHMRYDESTDFDGGSVRIYPGRYECADVRSDEHGLLIAAAVNALPGLLADLADAQALTAALRITGQRRILDLTDERDALAAKIEWVRALVHESDDGTEWEHVPDCQGEPTCPACWTAAIRRALDESEG